MNLDTFMLLLVPVLPLMLAIPLLRRSIPRFEYLAVLPVFLLFFLADDELVKLPWLLLGTGFESSFETRLMLLLSTLFWIPAAHVLSAASSTNNQDAAGGFCSTFFLLTLSGYSGAILTTDLVGFFTFSTLMGYGFYGLLVCGAEQTVKRAARVYLCFIVVADLLLFEALLIAASATRYLGFDTVHEVMADSDSIALYLAIVLFGFSLKAAIWPLHYWLVTAFRSTRLEVAVLVAGVPVAVAMLGMVRWLPLGEIALPGLGMLISGLGGVAFVYGVYYAWQRLQSSLTAYIVIIATGLFSMMLGAVFGEPSRWLRYESLLMGFIVFTGAAIAIFCMASRFLQAGKMQTATREKIPGDDIAWFENVSRVFLRWGAYVGFEVLPRMRTSCRVYVRAGWQSTHWNKKLLTTEQILQSWPFAIMMFLLLVIALVFLLYLAG